VRVPGVAMGIEIFENKGSGKFREKGVRSRIELSVSDGRGVLMKRRGEHFGSR